MPAAFALFGGYSSARADWQLSGELYDVAAIAVSGERARRQQSIAEFCAQWEAARLRRAREVG